MNLTAYVVSLALASTTGWALLALGALPVSVLREHGRQPLAGAGGWIVVAMLAPPGVFHWYLIFAILCLIAFTKIDRPAGKVWLAAAAALGLGIGIVFPLEIIPALLAGEGPFALASLYLGGATTGVAYVMSVLATPDADRKTSRATAKALLIFVVAWAVLLAFGLLNLARVPRPLALGDNHTLFIANAWTPLGPMLVMGVLAFFVWRSVNHEQFIKARWLAAGAGATAFLTCLLAQFLIRTTDTVPLLAASL